MKTIACKSLVAFAGLMGACSGPAWAVPINDVAGYQEYGAVACTSHTVTLCDDTKFTKIPAGKVLRVTNVSCNYSVASGTEPEGLYLVSAAGVNFLKPTAAGYTNGAVYYASNDQILAIEISNEAPTIVATFTAATKTTLSCMISGQLITN